MRDSHLLRSDVKVRRDKMVGLVETMPKLYKDLPKAKTPHEQESIQRQIAATGKQIDALVCELRGLTEEETGMVEGQSDGAHARRQYTQGPSTLLSIK